MKNFWMNLLACMALILLPITAFAGEGKVELTSTNSVSLVGEVNQSSVGEVIDFLLKSPEKKVYVYIDSPGGSVFDGLQLAEVMENSDKEIVCIANTAASMAFYLLQSCDTRLVTKSAIVMQHVPSYGLRGNEPNNYSFAKFIRRVSIEMDLRQAKRIGMPFKKFRSLTRNDWWLFGSQSIKYKVADDTTSVTCSKELTDKVVEREFTMLFWVIKLKFSRCPLLTAPIKDKDEKDAKQLFRLGGSDSDAYRELKEFMHTLDTRRMVFEWYREGNRTERDRINYFIKE